jgi:hypothetical protein
VFVSFQSTGHDLRGFNSKKAFECNDGENGLADLDTALSRHPEKESKRIIVDFPIWMVASLDRETQRLGVTRQSIIKIWLAERLQQGH